MPAVNWYALWGSNEIDYSPVSLYKLNRILHKPHTAIA